MPRRHQRRGGGSYSRRALLLLGGTALATGGVYQSGAFNVVRAPRDTQVGVSSDDAALLGIGIHEPTGNAGSEITMFTLTNHFDSPLDSITVSVGSSGNMDVTDLSMPDQLNIGESGEVTATISCADTTTESIEVDIAVSGPEASVDATRSVTVTCQVVFDPYDCHDVWEKGLDQCDYEKGSELALAEETLDGSVCISSIKETDIELEEEATIEGFVRIEGVGHVTVELEESTIEGALVINGCGRVDLKMGGSEIQGDVCIRTSSSAFIEMEDSVIEGEMKISASYVDVDLNESTVSGGINEEWDSDWSNDHCAIDSDDDDGDDGDDDDGDDGDDDGDDDDD